MTGSGRGGGGEGRGRCQMSIYAKCQNLDSPYFLMVVKIMFVLKGNKKGAFDGVEDGCENGLKDYKQSAVLLTCFTKDKKY